METIEDAIKFLDQHTDDDKIFDWVDLDDFSVAEYLDETTELWGN